MAIPLSPKTIDLMSQSEVDVPDRGDIYIFEGMAREASKPVSVSRPKARRDLEPLASTLVTIIGILVCIYIFFS